MAISKPTFDVINCFFVVVHCQVSL